MGEIQPVGGVIEKIEGFYQVCKQRGLTGSQGVVIPVQNVECLVLKAEVNKAVEEGQFHIWAISNVNQGIEILTGLPAGKRTQKGSFQTGTVNGIVEKKLRAMSRISKEHDSQ
jgi:predicted ATP-dependent protease